MPLYCCFCGTENEDVLRIYDFVTYCDDCFYDNYIQCECCEEYCGNDDYNMHYVIDKDDELYMCEDCIEKNDDLEKCEECQNYKHHSLLNVLNTQQELYYCKECDKDNNNDIIPYKYQDLGKMIKKKYSKNRINIWSDNLYFKLPQTLIANGYIKIELETMGLFDKRDDDKINEININKLHDAIEWFYNCPENIGIKYDDFSKDEEDTF